MPFHLTNPLNVPDAGLLELDGASYATTAVVGGTTYLFVTGKDDDGISVFSVAADGALTNVFNVTDNNTTFKLDGALGLATAEVGGTTYLYVGGSVDYGLTAFSVAADGSLTYVGTTADDPTLRIALTADVTTAVIGGVTYLFAAGVNDDGVSVFSVGANGALTNVDNVTDGENTLFEIQGAHGLATAVVGGTSYLFVTGFNDNGVSVFSVAANGDLTNVFNVADRKSVV